MENYKSFVKENMNIYNGLSAGVILFTTMVVPKLSYNILKFVNNAFVQLVVMILLLLISLKNVPLALFGGLALVMMIIKFNNIDTDDKILESIKYTDAANILNNKMVSTEDESLNLPQDMNSSENMMSSYEIQSSGM